MLFMLVDLGGEIYCMYGRQNCGFWLESYPSRPSNSAANGVWRVKRVLLQCDC